jgi:GxxExxY protein
MRALNFEREKEMGLKYKSFDIGTRRVDFFVEDSILLEIKALTKLGDVHLAQGLNYLVAYKVDKGLLLNFGAQSLEIKRLRHPKNKQNPIIP